MVSVASFPIIQPLQDFEGGQALRDQRSELWRQAAGPPGARRDLGGQRGPPSLVGLQVLSQPKGGRTHEEEVPRQRGLLLCRWRPLLLGGGLLPLVPEDGGEAGIGGRAGAFTFAGFEEELMVQVVQEVVLVVVDMVVLWRGCCKQCRRTLYSIDVLVNQVWGTFTEDLLNLSLGVGR